jgi:mannitol 2-dehydrogenase
MEQEATPTLLPVPGIDLEAYRRELVARFSNPAVRDTLARLAFDGSERLTKWLLPVVRDNLAAGGEVRLSAAVVAGWARYSEGVDEEGRPIEIADRRRDPLMTRARRQREEPLAFLADRDLFGDLVDDERFTVPYLAALTSLYEHGARATLEALVGPPAPAPAVPVGR